METISDYAFAQGYNKRIKFLCQNASFGKSVFGSQAIAAGYSGSTIQSYATANDIYFIALDDPQNLILQDSWFKDIETSYTYNGKAFTPKYSWLLLPHRCITMWITKSAAKIIQTQVQQLSTLPEKDYSAALQTKPLP